MAAAKLTQKGQIVIPAEIRARYGLTPGTQVEFVDEGGVIRLVIKRRIAPSVPDDGYGMLKAKPLPEGAAQRSLSDFDPASLMQKKPSQ